MHYNTTEKTRNLDSYNKLKDDDFIENIDKFWKLRPKQKEKRKKRK